MNICQHKINETINDNSRTIIVLFNTLLEIKYKFLNSSNTINNVLFFNE